MVSIGVSGIPNITYASLDSLFKRTGTLIHGGKLLLRRNYCDPKLGTPLAHSRSMSIAKYNVRTKKKKIGLQIHALEFISRIAVNSLYLHRRELITVNESHIEFTSQNHRYNIELLFI